MKVLPTDLTLLAHPLPSSKTRKTSHDHQKQFTTFKNAHKIDDVSI
jgi:hypothetical protein